MASLDMATQFTIDVSTTKVEDIRRRVANFPWHSFRSPVQKNDADPRKYGPPAEFMQRLCQHWSNKYDWVQRQERMNTRPHWKTNISGLNIHFVHLRSTSQPSEKPPVLLLHGWPYSFHSFHEVAQRLASPERFGGDAKYARDVVIPSMPGYDFSDAPAAGLIGPKAIAGIYNELMVNVLGYNQYIAHGGDWGSYVAEMLGFFHSDHCIGIHLSMISVRHHGAAPKSGQFPADASDEERAFAEDELRRWTPESAYAKLQSSRPCKLGYAMVDSPVGVAAWIVEAFHAWSDLSHERSFEEVYSMDELLDEIMLYLVTDSFHTSTWLYVGEFEEGSNTLPPGQRIEVPVGILALPDPVFPMLPRAVAERSHRVVEYDVGDHGGHFPFYEAREKLVDSLRSFMSML